MSSIFARIGKALPKALSMNCFSRISDGITCSAHDNF